MAKKTIRDHIINLEGLREQGATKKDIRDYLLDEGVTEKEAKDLQTIIQSSTTANRLRQLAQGLTFGFGDEIEGSIRSLFGGGTRDEEIDKARAQVKAYEDLLPYESMGLQIAGGLPSGLLGAGRAAVGSGARMIPKIFRGASAGTVHGGLSGAGRAEGGLDERLEGAKTGAKFGAVTGAAFPVVTSALKGGLGLLGRTVAPTTTKNIQANMMLRRAMDDDALTPDLIRKGLTQLPAKLGRIPDVAGKRANALRDLTRAAIAQQGQKGGAKFLGERQDEAGMRALESVDTNLANEGLDDFIDRTENERRLLAKKNYGNAYAQELKLTDDLKVFFNNKKIQNAFEGAKDLAEWEGINLDNLVEKIDGGIKFTKPTLELMDFIKQSLDDRVNELYKAGKSTAATKAKTLRNDFRDYLDAAVPEYKKARSDYAGASAAMEAANIGRDFIEKPKKISTRILNNFGNHEKEAFQVGVAEALRYKIMNTDEGLNVAKKLFNKPEIKKRLRLAFTDDASFKKFEQDMNNEIQMFQTGERGLGGSPTKRIEMDVDALKVRQAANDLANMNVGNLVGNLFGESPDAPEEVNARISELLLDKAKEEEALKILSRGSPALRNTGSRIPSILRNVLSQQSQRISE